MSLATDLHPNVRIRIGVAFVQRLLDSMVMTFMAIYLAQAYGLAAAGLMVLVVMLLGVLGSFLGGHTADIRGRRPTLLIGELGMVVTFALMALGDSNLLHAELVVYLGYALNKLAAGYALPANDAMIIDVTAPESRKLVYTVNYWSINLALACGALVGAILYDGHFTKLLTAASIGMALVLATTVFFLTETKPETAEPRPTGQPGGPSGVTAYLRVLKDKTFGRLVLAAILVMTIELQLINYLGVRLARDFPHQLLFDLGGWQPTINGVEMLGILRSENTALVVLLALGSHLALRHVSDRVRLYLGITLFTAGYVTLAISNSAWILIAAAAVFTIGELMEAPVRQTIVANVVPAESRTRYMAVYNLNIRVGLVLASLCVTLGAIIPSWGMGLLYAILGLLVLVQYRAILSATASAPPPTAQAQGSTEQTSAERSMETPATTTSS